MGTLNVTLDYLIQQLSDTMVTPLGGIAIKIINKTGAASIKGTLLGASETTTGSVEILAEAHDCIGIMYSDGVADGEEVWMVISGIAEVLLKDGQAGILGYWTFSSTTNGRAEMLEAPAGGTIGELESHFNEIGHSIQAIADGTDVLCKIVLHFN